MVHTVVSVVPPAAAVVLVVVAAVLKNKTTMADKMVVEVVVPMDVVVKTDSRVEVVDQVDCSY